jgi:hypothetical protein
MSITINNPYAREIQIIGIIEQDYSRTGSSLVVDKILPMTDSAMLSPPLSIFELDSIEQSNREYESGEMGFCDDLDEFLKELES